LHPSLARWLTERVGWQQSWLWLGLLTWILVLPVFYWLSWSRPEPLGLVQDGHKPHVSVGSKQTGNGALIGMSLREARATRTFWTLGISLGAFSALVTGLFLFQVSILQSRDIEISAAAAMFTVSAITMVVFVPVFGRMLDRFRAERVFAVGLLTMSAALLAASLVRDGKSAIVYALLFGLANAAMHAHYVYLWAYYFGRKHLGSIQGFATLISVIGASVGGLPLGWAWDRFASYTGVLWALALIPLLCALMVLAIRAPRLQ